MNARQPIIATILFGLVIYAGVSTISGSTARADDADLLAYLLQQYAEAAETPQIQIPSDDRFDITRFLGQPDPYVPEPYRFSWADRYFYDGGSPAPWFSIPWPDESWRGPF